jgi:hypothetical protein
MQFEIEQTDVLAAPNKIGSRDCGSPRARSRYRSSSCPAILGACAFLNLSEDSRFHEGRLRRGLEGKPGLWTTGTLRCP